MSDKKPAPSSQRANDERNLVNVDEAFAEADLDDRLWLWWQRNGKTLMLVAAVLIVGVVGYELTKLFRQQSFERMQADYNTSGTDAANQKAFALKHGSQPLGGFAFLLSADQHYQEKQFLEAADLYARAAEALVGTLPGGRAQLGQAMAILKAGEVDKGTALLSQLADSAQAAPTIRAEAAYKLAIHHLGASNPEAARPWLAKVEAVDSTEVWKSQVQALRRNVPELAATPEAS
jgi:hypothetical protein